MFIGTRIKRFFRLTGFIKNMKRKHHENLFNPINYGSD